MTTIECVICKKSFETTNAKTKFCPECRVKKKSKCSFCQTDILIEKAIIEQIGVERKFCGADCRDAWKRKQASRPTSWRTTTTNLRFKGAQNRRADSDEAGPWNENARRNLEGD